VFTGGFDEDAAVAVCSGSDLPPAHVAMYLASLVEQSIIQRDSNRRPPRYSMLEAVRQYGRHRLRDPGQEVASQRRHRDWILQLARAVGAVPAAPRTSNARIHSQLSPRSGGGRAASTRLKRWLAKAPRASTRSAPGEPWRGWWRPWPRWRRIDLDRDLEADEGSVNVFVHLTHRLGALSLEQGQQARPARKKDRAVAAHRLTREVSRSQATLSASWSMTRSAVLTFWHEALDDEHHHAAAFLWPPWDWWHCA
jgi:hypothetical protein